MRRHLADNFMMEIDASLCMLALNHYRREIVIFHELSAKFARRHTFRVRLHRMKHAASPPGGGRTAS